MIHNLKNLNNNISKNVVFGTFRLNLFF
uniref:Uncharacterized protein n=1 Tax=Anguilla anguilla TaxID=7936 RepID=A0A0E9RZB5_ANGAN